jgi:hypothetical protein
MGQEGEPERDPDGVTFELEQRAGCPCGGGQDRQGQQVNENVQ